MSRPISSGETIAGGVHEVRRVGDVLERPAGPHSPAVHALLRHLRAHGFEAGPEALELDRAAGMERLSWVEGTTLDPLVAHRSDAVLGAGAATLRSLHDASRGFDVLGHGPWYLPPREPAEVVCHGDFGPYNCTIRADGSVGVFDFDTVYPGPRLDDLGYMAFRWVPLKPPAEGEDRDAVVREQHRRLAIALEAYGYEGPMGDVVDAARTRVEVLIEFITQRAAAGDAAFQKHLERGDDRRYREATAWMEEVRPLLA